MSPRRLVLVLVLVLWCINGVLLAWVKTSGGPVGPQQAKIFTVYIEKPDAAKRLQKSLEAAKIKVAEFKANQPWKHDVIDGFICIVKLDNKDVAKAMAQSMRNVQLSVKIVDEGIQLGGTYKTKAEAVRATKAAAKKNFTFEVVENHAMRTSKAVRIKTAPLNEEQAQKVEELLAPLKLKDDQSETETVEFTPSPTPG